MSGNIEEDIMLLGQQHLANNHDQSKDYDMMGSISLRIIGMTKKPTNHGLNCGFIQQSLACVSSAVVGLHYTVIYVPTVHFHFFKINSVRIVILWLCLKNCVTGLIQWLIIIFSLLKVALLYILFGNS